MALLIYKQWHRPPNQIKRTTTANKNHVHYIGTRQGVLTGKNADNGLFGNVDNKFYPNLPMKQILNRVQDISEKGHTVYRSVISIKPDENLGLGYEISERERWQLFAKYHAKTIAEKNGIKEQDLEWVAAAHEKGEGESFHLHFVFWDKNQDVAVNIVDPNIPDEVRKAIEEDVAKDVLLDNGYELDSKEANEIRTALIKHVFIDELTSINKSIGGVKKNIKSEAEGSVNEFSDKRKALKMLAELNADRPRKGANKYAYMPASYKEKLDKFTDFLIEKDGALRAEVEKYFALTQRRSDIFNSRETNYGKYQTAKNIGKARDEVYNRIGNKILQYMKLNRDELDRLSGRFKSGSSHKYNHGDDHIMKLTSKLTAIMSLANQNAGGDEMPDSDALGRGDLSKDALKDLAYKKEDKGYEM